MTLMEVLLTASLLLGTLLVATGELPFDWSNSLLSMWTRHIAPYLRLVTPHAVAYSTLRLLALITHSSTSLITAKLSNLRYIGCYIQKRLKDSITQVRSHGRLGMTGSAKDAPIIKRSLKNLILTSPGLIRNFLPKRRSRD